MNEEVQLINAITKGIQEKKGSGIVIADLRHISGTICSYFVICQGNSPQQVDAITDSIEETVRIDTAAKPLHVIGRENAQWVAMDYSDVMVHVFLPEPREYYSLETLWEDAKLTRIPDLD